MTDWLQTQLQGIPFPLWPGQWALVALVLLSTAGALAFLLRGWVGGRSHENRRIKLRFVLTERLQALVHERAGRVGRKAEDR